MTQVNCDCSVNQPLFAQLALPAPRQAGLHVGRAAGNSIVLARGREEAETVFEVQLPTDRVLWVSSSCKGGLSSMCAPKCHVYTGEQKKSISTTCFHFVLRQSWKGAGKSPREPGIKNCEALQPGSSQACSVSPPEMERGT